MDDSPALRFRHTMGASPAPVVLPDQTNLLPRRQLLVVFGVMALAFFAAYADQNGVAVALPRMAAELRAVDSASWAGTAALVANTVFQPLYGRLSDIFGRRAVYLSALLLLAAADALCATARSAGALYAFRGLAGVAAGGVNSLTMMIVSDVVTLQDRGRYQGLLGSCIGLGNTAGPLLSAAFVQAWSWRGFFCLLAPLVLLCAALAWRLLPSAMPAGQGLAKARLVDWYGLVFGSVAIVFLLLPLSGGGSYFRWDSPMVLSMLVIGGVSVLAFLYVEWRVAELPMVPSTSEPSGCACLCFLGTNVPQCPCSRAWPSPPSCCRTSSSGTAIMRPCTSSRCTSRTSAECSLWSPLFSWSPSSYRRLSFPWPRASTSPFSRATVKSSGQASSAGQCEFTARPRLGPLLRAKH